ncbi:MAG: hypothetical protein RL322_851 [Pseudomonadota bacterium]
MRPESVGAVITGTLALIIGVMQPAIAQQPAGKPAAEAPRLTPDQAFLAARRAYLKRDLRGLDAAASQARGHLLADYFDYWRLSLKPRGADGSTTETERAIERMLQQHSGGVPAGLLRRVWLDELATRGDWARFDRHYALQELDPDPGLRCQRHRSKLKQQGTLPRAGLDTLLMVPREIPSACQRLFEDLLQSGVLGPRDVERRMFRAIESGNPGAIRQGARTVGLPSETLSRALSTTAQGSSRPDGRWATLIRLSQLARKDPAQAAEQLNAAHPELGAPDRAFLWSQIAAAGMKRMLPESHAWARQGAQATSSDETLAWLARAALRERDWRLLADLIERMSPAARQDAGWMYWAARSLAERGQRDESARLLIRIADGFDFYGLLAREDLGRPIQLPVRTRQPLDAADIEAVERRTGLKRALRLYQLGLRADGNREWTHALSGLSDRELLAVATWACQRGIPDRCVNTAERTREEHDFALRFITPFRDDIQRASAERGLDPAWVYGLIRQESRFITNIGSSAGAQGLMQIMPATGRWIAGKLDQRNFRIEQLHEPRTNIRFGTFYLKNVLDDLGGSPVLASAGYNAGPRRPMRWQETLPTPLEAEIFAAIIPFDETRDYVKKVLANATVYATLLSGQPQSLRAWLGGPIGPRTLPPGGQP